MVWVLKEKSLETRSQGSRCFFLKSDRAKLELIESGQKLLKTSESKGGGKNRLRHLLFQLEAKALKPDLTTKLSPSEDKIRAHLTWQAFDRMLWKACFAP